MPGALVGEYPLERVLCAFPPMHPAWTSHPGSRFGLQAALPATRCRPAAARRRTSLACPHIPLPAVDLRAFKGEHDEYSSDDKWFGDVVYAVQLGLQEFVHGCDASTDALHSLENGLRALCKVGGSGS